MSQSSFLFTPREQYIRDFVTRGLIVLAPHQLGVPLELHEEIYELERTTYQNKERITAETIPDIMKVTEAPGVRDACEMLVGKNYAIVPFTHNTPFMSGSNDQHWHKDDNGPYNMRKQRHHQAVQVEMLYYPQEVKADMGPTATVPYSQYWTFNHEENHDNFAGADHLDFGYQINGMERIPISGPKSTYALEEIINQTTAHDIRMRDAVLNLQWPHCQPFEVGPLEAGSVVLYSHNLLHRGNHRRDDWQRWRDNPRFMWRFWLYRTTEPQKPLQSSASQLHVPLEDDLTHQDLANVSPDVRAVWHYQFEWLHGNATAGLTRETDSADEEASTEYLGDRLLLTGDRNEPKRIGAAYRLAAHPDREQALGVLETAINHDRESVRRAALYGLIAIGEDTTELLLRAVSSDARWVRKAAAFTLGSAGRADRVTIEALGVRLLSDPSAYVRSVAADALGCLARRAAVISESVEHILSMCAELLVASLRQEANRLSMDRAQSRSIKMVRPTDECDVCEGIGFAYGQTRYEPVRSVVRENALWAMVIVCSHGADKLGEFVPVLIETLEHIVANDKNVFSVGLAMDALQRLSSIESAYPNDTTAKLSTSITDTFKHTPIYSLEALVASGMPMRVATSEYAKIAKPSLLREG